MKGARTLASRSTPSQIVRLEGPDAHREGQRPGDRPGRASTVRLQATAALPSTAPYTYAWDLTGSGQYTTAGQAVSELIPGVNTYKAPRCGSPTRSGRSSIVDVGGGDARAGGGPDRQLDLSGRGREERDVPGVGHVGGGASATAAGLTYEAGISGDGSAVVSGFWPGRARRTSTAFPGTTRSS